MAIEFSILDDNRAVLIEIDGDIVAEQVHRMRQRSVDLVEETGYKDFIVDMRKLESLEHGQTFAIYDLGEEFGQYALSVWSNTAVLMPADARLREQIEFLHTVEINRGRGVINYVESVDEAFSWLEEMAGRAGTS